MAKRRKAFEAAVRGVMERWDSDQRGALEIARRASRRWPDTVYFSYSAARFHVEFGEMKPALDFANRALTCKDKGRLHALSLQAKGQALMGLGRFAEALAALEASSAVERESHTSLLVAQALRRLGRVQDARNLLVKALNEKLFEESIQELIEVTAEIGEDFIELWTEHLQHHEIGAEDLSAIAGWAIGRERFREAEWFLTRAFERDPEHFWTMLWTAHIS